VASPVVLLHNDLLSGNFLVSESLGRLDGGGETSANGGGDSGRGFLSFTLELNLSNSRTDS
jgi:hypothetical protein